MHHLISRFSRISLRYAHRLLLYTLFFPMFGLWLLAQLFGEWFWPLDTLTQFQVQFSYAFLIFAIIFHLSHRPTGMHLSTLALLYILLQFLPFYHPSAPPACPEQNCRSESLRIVQFNVFIKNERINEILRWSKASSQRTDILILQEIPLRLQPLLEQLKPFYPYSFITYDATPYNMAILSKMPLHQLESWGDGTQRDVAVRVHGETPVHKIPFQLYAIHVSSPLSLKDWKQRNRALRFHGWQLRDFSQTNQIIAGDFNTTAFSPWFRRILNASNLKDAQNGFGLMPTWSFFEPPNLVNGLQIDHMLVSREIYVHQRNVLDDLGSDHLPIFTRLMLYAKSPSPAKPPVSPPPAGR